jgi:hypothetical protein
VPVDTDDHAETLALLARLYPTMKMDADAKPVVKTA